MKAWLGFSLAAMAFLAVRAIVQKFAVDRWENWKVGFLATLVSLATWAVIAWTERQMGWASGPGGKPVPWSWPAVGWTVACGLVSTLGAAAGLWALKCEGAMPGKISCVISSYIALTVLLSRFIFGETWTARQAFGAGLIMVGVGVMSTAKGAK